MDYSASSAAPPVIPPIARHHTSRKPLSTDSRRYDESDRIHVPPASPEVISSLITSLSIISKPANSLFDNQALSLPSSPPSGSFGVDYGAYSSPSTRIRLTEQVSLDELAASPPVIRTAPPPSGLSSLTAPKSPKSPKTPKRESSSGGLRSFLRSSRPSSRGSASSHDDTRSIGNLSVERGLAPTPELHRRRSHDSWGKKSGGGRSQKGLMYMSSKERLRASEVERKRSSTGAAGSSLDPSFAEMSISEEPLHADPPTIEKQRSHSFEMSGSIPVRDSSLRKTGMNSTKRSSHRSSRTRREGDKDFTDSIPEKEERDHLSELGVSKRRHYSQYDSETEATKRKEEARRSDPTLSRTTGSQRRDDGSKSESGEAVPDEGAPFPSIYSSRRRSARSTERRKSGRTTPEPNEAFKTKRSSSRLNRLSVGPKNSDTENGRATSPEPHVTYERPRSADSVDDAVESYLCSPRLSQKIKHPQTGRVISFSEVGDADGSAVFCCVGMGLTRYIMAFYDELALTLKLRLITPDRPGVGDSEPYSDGTATPLSWPDDVYAICQALKITKFSILAHSAGAIYALATALRMPQHIRGRIHLLAPWIPPSQMNVFGGSQVSPPTNAIPTSQRILRALPTPFLKAANSSFMTATSSSITSSLPKTPRRSKKKSSTPTSGRRDATPGLDKENVSQDMPDPSSKPAPIATENMDQIRPLDDEFNPRQHAILDAATASAVDKERQVTYDTRLTHAIWALATTGANPAVDLLVCLERRHTIGFRYVDITRPVIIHHGSRDNRVPVENVRWLGKTMRRCEVRVLEGEGHGLMASASVMGSVLMEISKEWEDWNRVTGTTNTAREGRRSRAGAR
ncbi:hypothetical protein BX600DRAFT_517310 [Xylariales sp. PMI_506]|nr:hypothetical protein BX600DRAFT_517310 [Xylariales sp. PMI_506]